MTAKIYLISKEKAALDREMDVDSINHSYPHHHTNYTNAALNPDNDLTRTCAAYLRTSATKSVRGMAFQQRGV